MNKQLLCIPFLLVILMVSCSPKTSKESKTKVIQHEINYYTRYLQGEGVLKAEANFYSRDTSVERKGQELVGDIFFAGKKMPVYKAGTQGLRYSLSLKEEAKKGTAFEIKYSNGTVFKHLINMPRLDSFWVSPISLSKGFNLSWEGEKLDSDETLIILLTDSKNKTLTMNRIHGTEKASLSVIAPQIEKANKGSGTLSLVRKKPQSHLEEGLTVGKMISEFYTKTIKIEIVD